MYANHYVALSSSTQAGIVRKDLYLTATDDMVILAAAGVLFTWVAPDDMIEKWAVVEIVKTDNNLNRTRVLVPSAQLLASHINRSKMPQWDDRLFSGYVPKLLED